MLSMECEIDGEDIIGIGFSGGKNDLSDYIWPFIEKFVEKGGKITSLLETGETVTVGFDGDEVEYDCDHDESCISEEAGDFFDSMEDDKLTEAAIDAIILKEGSINFTDYSERTPLILACQNYRWAIEHYTDAIEDYADAVDEEESDDIDEYSSQLATHEHNLNLILSKNPDLNRKDEDGDSALSYAIESKNMAFIEKLLSHGAKANSNCLMRAAESLAVDAFDLIVNMGLSARDSDVLIRASAAASFETTKLSFIHHLVEHHHCDVNRKATHKMSVVEGYLRRGSTPIMAAALTDDYELVKYLIERGAALDAQDNYLNTALHYCSGQTWIGGNCQCCWFAREENSQVIELLLESGANPLLKNAAGYTPLDIAKRQENDIAIKLYEPFFRKA